VLAVPGLSFGYKYKSLLARITRRSLDQLRLEQGMEVYAMIKTIPLDRHRVGFA
jgi:molybdopterin-binding protein